jgi:uncharacterized protein (DUF305 family)
MTALTFGVVAAAPAERPDPASTFVRAMHESMAKMTREMESVAMTGDPDHDFLVMMIPHHAGAVEMARLELIHGRDPLARRLAEEIIASQQGEIAAMRARLAILKKRRDADPDGFPAIHGTRGERASGEE